MHCLHAIFIAAPTTALLYPCICTSVARLRRPLFQSDFWLLMGILYPFDGSALYLTQRCCVNLQSAPDGGLRVRVLHFQFWRDSGRDSSSIECGSFWLLQTPRRNPSQTSYLWFTPSWAKQDVTSEISCQAFREGPKAPPHAPPKSQPRSEYE
jgi:hypothetical protein